MPAALARAGLAHPVHATPIVMTPCGLAARLRDRRSRKVVYLSHCLLDEGTRYLGGAGRPACVAEIVEQCIAHDLGMVQMPCPEEEAWGGVLKRRLLALYGLGAGRPRVAAVSRRALPAALLAVRWIYRRLARRVAARIADRVASGFEVVAVVGVDGSPSCGVSATLDPARAAAALAGLRPAEATVAGQEALLRGCLVAGEGLFVAELRRQLRRRGLEIPFLAHDLFAELDGRRSAVELGGR